MCFILHLSCSHCSPRQFLDMFRGWTRIFITRSSDHLQRFSTQQKMSGAPMHEYSSTVCSDECCCFICSLRISILGIHPSPPGIDIDKNKHDWASCAILDLLETKHWLLLWTLCIVSCLLCSSISRGLELFFISQSPAGNCVDVLVMFLMKNTWKQGASHHGTDGLLPVRSLSGMDVS